MEKGAKPYTHVERYNHANVKRLSRTFLRKALFSKHSSIEFKAIVIAYLNKPKDHGTMFSRRKYRT